MSTPSSEAVRIHCDWWGECRTCRHYTGNRSRPEVREEDEGKCDCPDSPLYGKPVEWKGQCEKWDSYDKAAAEIAKTWNGQGEDPSRELARQELKASKGPGQ